MKESFRIVADLGVNRHGRPLKQTFRISAKRLNIQAIRMHVLPKLKEKYPDLYDNKKIKITCRGQWVYGAL